MTLLSRGDITGLTAVYVYVAAVITLSWALRHRIGRPRELVHILTGGVVFFWWTFDSKYVMSGLAALPFVFILVLATPGSPVKWLREGPLGQRSSEGHEYGLVMYAVSWTVIAFFLFGDLYAASIAIAAMSFGDGAGEIIGRRFGRFRYAPHRTVEGSAAVFAATFASILVLGWFYFSLIGYGGGSPPAIPILFAAAIAGLVTFLEGLTPGSMDNLVIPVVIAALLHGMGA